MGYNEVFTRTYTCDACGTETVTHHESAYDVGLPDGWHTASLRLIINSIEITVKDDRSRVYCSWECVVSGIERHYLKALGQSPWQPRSWWDRLRGRRA